MNLRGDLYRVAASLVGAEWREHLLEMETSASGEIERRSLPSLLTHALTHVPHYRDLGVSAARLDAFPLLTRETLRTQYERLKSDDLASRRWHRTSTGGSTGEPVWVVLDRNFLQWDYAADMYCMNAFCGMPYQEYLAGRRVAIWHRRRLPAGAGLWRRLAAQLLGQVAYIEPYEILTDEKLNEHLARINRHKPAVILAFAGTAFEIARHAQRVGIRMHRPRFILTSVEMLYPAMRETIQAAFGCPVHNWYGAAEVGRIATECSERKLHVSSFTQHAEVIDSDGRPTRPGNVGRVVVTPMHNLAMPLIRYDIGDLARVSSEPCACGNPTPTWDEICGRVVHHFVRPDGGVVFGGNFIAMFYEHDWIMQFSVLQEDVDRVVISYRRTPGRDVPEHDIDALTQTVRAVMGENCSVVWNEVDVVPNSPIGKHLHARSLVWENRVGIRGS